MQRTTAFLAFLGVIVLLLAFTAHESRSAGKGANLAKASFRIEKTVAR